MIVTFMVPNGSLRNFHCNEFADGNCEKWGIDFSIEGAEARLRDLAMEDALSESRAMTMEDAEKFADEAVANHGFEWKNDLKFICLAKTDENGDIIEIL